MGEEIVFTRRASGLVRELSWLDIAIWAIATPAGSGMTYYAVKILGDPAAYGGSLPLAFFIAGLMFLPLVIAFAMITTSFPRSNSLYVFVSRTIHPVLGFLPFWYFIIGGGCAMTAGFMMVVGLKALSGPLVVASALTGDPALLRIGEAASDPNIQLIVALILVALLWIINYLGMKVIKWVLRILTIVPMVVTILVLAYLAILGGNAGLSKWDQVFGAGVAEEIMRVAYQGDPSLGVQPLTRVDMWSGTYEMLLWTLWAWTGLEIVTFVGSEVKDPSKSYIKGYITGFTLVMVLYLLNAFIIPWVFNYDFLAAYAYLKSEYPDALSKIMGAYALPDPSVPLVASVAVGNAVIAVLIGLSYFLWYVNTALPVWVGGVRGFFSMAFDRVLPEKMAEVSPRWAAPTWANHVTALIALFGAVMTYLENLGYELATALISFLDFSLFIFVWPVGLALMLIPWWKPELFKRMTITSPVTATVIGAIVFALGWYFMIYTSYSQPLIVLVNITVGLIGLIIFTAMSARNRSRGIEPEKIYGEIPPA
ncbi:APC family permease [Desulfurococcus amylolyticus]|uniref:APC family permease n=1 Tax=Desulfurococcus amylolyticus TaxID=94694 RepID=UPI0023F3BFB8|nr:APC family permease [Desulfurococcus amylolyticus]